MSIETESARRRRWVYAPLFALAIMSSAPIFLELSWILFQFNAGLALGGAVTISFVIAAVNWPFLALYFATVSKVNEEWPSLLGAPSHVAFIGRNGYPKFLYTAWFRGFGIGRTKGFGPEQRTRLFDWWRTFWSAHTRCGRVVFRSIDCATSEGVDCATSEGRSVSARSVNEADVTAQSVDSFSMRPLELVKKV